MLIFKIILGIIGAVSLYKAIELDNIKKAYDYFFSATIMFAIIFLVQPVI